jgi:hypothetical protein
MSQVGAIVVLLAATAFGCRAQEVAPVGAIDGSVPTQLPRGVRPLHYDVRLDPQPATKRFTAAPRSRSRWRRRPTA